MTTLDDFFAHYYRYRPVNATFTGVHGSDDRLPDWSPEGLDSLDAEMASLGRALTDEYPPPHSAAAFGRNPDLLDADLARGFLEIQQAENASRHGPRGNPALWTGEAVFSIISLMIRDFAPVDERIEAAERRLAGLSTFLSLPRQPVPRAWLERALRDCQGAEVLLTTGFERWLASASISDVRLGDVRRAVAEGRAVFRAFADRLRHHPEAPNDTMACGPELFDLLLGRGHFCLRSRADVLAEARERFADARAALDTLAKEVAGSWPAAQEQLAADHPAPAAYLASFEKTWRDCHDRASQADVVSWPDWPIRYAPFPAWTADAAPYLYYLYYRSPAAFDPYITYDYVVPPLPSDPDAAARHLRAWNHSAIKLNHVVHHGAIGHHVQNWFAYHQQRSRVGKIAAVDCANRIGMFCGGTLAEGWACYATDLMEEIGFLSPLERVAQQHSRVRMLARAIVDIELHQGSMSFEEAVRFYIDGVGMSADAVRAEAVKNSMFPCTALMYWLGTQGIHDLRADARRRQGSRFVRRRFHSELLGYGSVPVALLSRILLEADA